MAWRKNGVINEEAEMKRNPRGVRALACFFFLLGVLWLVTIYSRCQVISLRTGGLSSGTTGYHFIKTAGMFTGCSSGVLPSSLLFFWALAALEMMCSFLYMISGFALLRGYKFCFRLGRSALWLDLFFKASTAAYMFGIAVPLQNALKNKQNVLLNYFTPDRSVFSDSSAFFSGLRFYYPALNFSLIIFFMYFLFTYIFVKQRMEETAESRRD